MILGASKIGKSEFLAQEDRGLFIETEAGLNFLKVFKVPTRSWEDVRNTYAALKALPVDKPFPYSMLAIDTIDRFVDLAEEEIVNRGRDFYKSIANQINSIGDIPNGGGWSKTRELVMGAISKFEEFPCAIALIGHLTIKKIEEGARKYDKSTISLWASMGNDILAWADHTLHIEAHIIGDKLVRTVWSIPTQSREAGSRGNIIPNGWRWSDNAKENWMTLRKLFV